MNDTDVDQREISKDLENIDKVVSLDEIKSKTNRAYTLANLNDNYTTEEYKEFIKSATKLCLKYPKDYIKCRVSACIISLGLDKEYGYLQTVENVKNFEQTIPKEFKPLNPNMQLSFSKLIGGQFNIGTINMYFFLWSLWLPILGTAVVFIIAIVTKQTEYVLISVMLLLQFFFTMMLAPVKYAMYYFMNYFVGWEMIILLVTSLKHKRHIKNN